MPLIVEPVKQIEQIQIQPSVDKVENSSVNSWEISFIFFLMLAIYILRAPLLAFVLFLSKFLILSGLAYTTYILFIQ